MTEILIVNYSRSHYDLITFFFPTVMKLETMLVFMLKIVLKLWRRLNAYWAYHQPLSSPSTQIRWMVHLLVEVSCLLLSPLPAV